MAGRLPEERVARPVVRQSWRDVAFLHWRADPYEIASLLPPGLVPDVVDGSAWIGLTPFEIQCFRVFDAPPLRLPLSPARFAETNVRTYVSDEHGTDGLWFFSLDVPDLLNAMGGRLAGAPYYLADMSVTREDGAVRYRSRRRVGPQAHHDLTIRPGAPIDERDVSDTVASLTGRWRAFSRVAGQLVTIAVEHEPWPLRHATVVECDESMLVAPGALAAVKRDTPMVHFSDGVDARIGAARLASGASLRSRFGRSTVG